MGLASGLIRKTKLSRPVQTDCPAPRFDHCPICSNTVANTLGVAMPQSTMDKMGRPVTIIPLSVSFGDIKRPRGPWQGRGGGQHAPAASSTDDIGTEKRARGVRGSMAALGITKAPRTGHSASSFGSARMTLKKWVGTPTSRGSSPASAQCSCTVLAIWNIPFC